MIVRLASVLVLAGFLMGNAAAQDFIIAHSQTEERPSGLLALPEIRGEYPCEPVEAKKLNLYATPSSQRVRVAIIERLNPQRPPGDSGCDELRVVVRRISDNSVDRLPTDESGYEHPTAVVYEQSGNWFRIAIPHGSAWIERPNTNGFISYPEHLSGEEFATYLRGGWDGKIWLTPGAGAGMQAPEAWLAFTKEEIPVRVISTQVVRGEKWVRLRFQTEMC